MKKISNLSKKKKIKRNSQLLIDIDKEAIIKEKNKNVKRNISENDTNYIEYISLSKIISSYAVVILNSNEVFWTYHSDKDRVWWSSANIIENIFYFAVPVFVLCIGATLLDFNEKYGIIKYCYKRIVKVVIPLIAWTYILYFFKVYFLGTIKEEKLSFENIWNIYYKHKTYNIFSSLHYFLKLYMIIPLLASIEKSKKIKMYTYGFIFLMIFQTIIPYVISLYNPKLEWIYKINYDYSHYLFAGYIIHNYKFSIFKRIIIYALGLAGLLTTIIGTKILTYRYNVVSVIHKGYLNLPVILYSCAVFLFIKENTHILLKCINKKYINKIGSLTIGPFFMHFPIIDSYLKEFKADKYSLRFRLLDGSLIYIFCLSLTYVLKQTPILKILVP